MIIDPDGLFNGDRFRRCSNSARLYWPYFFLASNGYGRLEVNYHRIVARAFSTFNPVPAEHELMGYVKEYQEAHLLFLYEYQGQIWGQWDCDKRFLNKYQNAQDKRSPAPPEKEFQEWRSAYQSEKAALPRIPQSAVSLPDNSVQISSPNSHEVVTSSSPNLPLGEGVGEGVGEGNKSFTSSHYPLAEQPVAAPDDVTEDQAAAYVCENLSLNGVTNRWTVVDAVKDVRKKYPTRTNKQIAEFLVDMWNKYQHTEKGGGKYAIGPKRFLSEGAVGYWYVEKEYRPPQREETALEHSERMKRIARGEK